jgi:hypothetical protein
VQWISYGFLRNPVIDAGQVLEYNVWSWSIVVFEKGWEDFAYEIA